MSEYRLPQHDDSAERAETVKAARSVYTYRMDYGVPVAGGELLMQDSPGREWQTKVLFHQEMLHLNMRSLVRSGRWRRSRPPTLHVPSPTPILLPSRIPNSTNI